MSRVLVVRHAEAGRRDRWPAGDQLRPLTDAGLLQARLLVDALRDAAVSRVLTSPYVRCRQTVEPIAHARGLPVELESSLAEGVDAERVLDLAGTVGDAVMCTHGDVVEGLIRELARLGVPRLGPHRWEKGSVWAVDVAGTRPVAATYLPAPVM